MFFFSRYNTKRVLHPLLPNLKTPTITFINEHTTWYCLQMLMLLSNKILFTGSYFVTFTSLVHCDILCVLLFHCMHVRMPYV